MASDAYDAPRVPGFQREVMHMGASRFHCIRYLPTAKDSIGWYPTERLGY